MKISKSLTSAVVATALVGAIGISYAQTGTGSANQSGQSGATQSVPANTPPQQQPADMANRSSTMGTSGTTGSTTSNDTAAFNAERPAQADRN